MSSVYVRDQIKTFLDANSSEDFIDLTSHFEDIRDLIKEAGLDHDANWVGIEFIGNGEAPQSVPATNDQGRYRESGAILIHIVAAAKLGAGNGLLTRGESLRNLLRGQRINQVVIEEVTPLNTASGATLQFEGGYMSASFFASYERDLNL